MKLHSKTIFVIIGTLIIGIAVGALSWSSIHNSRSRQLAEMRRQGGLYGSIDRYIDPTDAVQEEALREMAIAYQDTVGRFWRHYKRHQVALMESLETDILPLLNEDQKTKITPWLDRITTLPESARRDSTRRRRAELRPDSLGNGTANGDSLRRP